MISVCGNPKLVITVHGGRNYFTMDEEIEKEFMNSMAEMSITSGKLRSPLQLFFFLQNKIVHFIDLFHLLRLMDHYIWPK